MNCVVVSEQLPVETVITLVKDIVMGALHRSVDHKVGYVDFRASDVEGSDPFRFYLFRPFGPYCRCAFC